MLKRPQPAEQEQPAQPDFAEEAAPGNNSHRAQHPRHPKNSAANAHNHTSRHHRKHEKLAESLPSTTTTTSTTAASISSATGQAVDFKDNSSLAVRNGLLDERTTEAGLGLPNMEMEESLLLVTPRPKKNGRRQRVRESADGLLPSLEADDERGQRRRKNHHKRKNSTILTNSVHDEAVPEAVSTESPVETLPTEQSVPVDQDNDDKTSQVQKHFVFYNF